MAPTPKQIAAVRKVLYAPGRVQTMLDHLSSIDVLMNLDSRRQLPPDDIRISAGAGPNWFLADSGAVDSAVLEAADRCDAVAGLLLDMRRELSSVNAPAADKQHLRAGLAEQAAAWTARGRIWRSPAPPSDVNAAVAPLAGHVQASVTAFQPVLKYLKHVRGTHS